MADGCRPETFQRWRPQLRAGDNDNKDRPKMSNNLFRLEKYFFV
jgi:hypothetical protein